MAARSPLAQLVQHPFLFLVMVGTASRGPPWHPEYLYAVLGVHGNPLPHNAAPRPPGGSKK